MKTIRSWYLLSRDDTPHTKRFLKMLETYREEVIVQFVNQPLQEGFSPNANDKFMVVGLDAINLLPSNVNPTNVVFVSLTYDLLPEMCGEADFELLKQFAFQGSKFICDCEFGRFQLQEKIGNPFESCTMVYGCDLEYFYEIPFLKSEDISILINRSWTNIHNNEFLFESLPLVSKQKKIKITSLEPTRDILNAAQYHLVDRVNVDFETINAFDVNELVHLLRANWLYISCSKVDGASVSLMEAMASGRICLVNDIPGNREFICDGFNGFLYENGNRFDLAESIEKIADLSTEQLIIISNNARSLALEKADWNKNKLMMANFMGINVGNS